MINKNGLDASVVDIVLKAIYETDLSTGFPLLMTPSEVKQWSLFPLKPASTRFLDPYRGLGVFSKFAESLLTLKELIVAVIGLFYFFWLSHKRRMVKQDNEQLSEFQEKLDGFLEETITLERMYVQHECEDKLDTLLTQATDIKFRALAELTDEKLRGDSLFAIFLAQCNNLILRIEQHIHSKDDE